jgi:hypothetical protein
MSTLCPMDSKRQGFDQSTVEMELMQRLTKLSEAEWLNLRSKVDEHYLDAWEHQIEALPPRPRRLESTDGRDSQGLSLLNKPLRDDIDPLRGARI